MSGRDDWQPLAPPTPQSSIQAGPGPPKRRPACLPAICLSAPPSRSALYKLLRPLHAPLLHLSPGSPDPTPLPAVPAAQRHESAGEPAKAVASLVGCAECSWKPEGCIKCWKAFYETLVRQPAPACLCCLALWRPCGGVLLLPACPALLPWLAGWHASWLSCCLRACLSSASGPSAWVPWVCWAYRERVQRACALQ
jgi:hypothetical protein